MGRGEAGMNWEIEDCLIRLENRMYEFGSERSASNDRYTVEEYIRELEKENKALCAKIIMEKQA
jgi:hypothetical protein